MRSDRKNDSCTVVKAAAKEQALASMRALSQRRTWERVRAEVFLATQFLECEEVEGHKTKNLMLMQAAQGTALKVVKSQFLLQLLITLFNFPALVSQMDKLSERCPFRKVGHIVFDRAITELFDQQPTQRTLSVIGAMMNGPHAQGGSLHGCAIAPGQRNRLPELDLHAPVLGTDWF